jgi:hypothetical protein
LICGREFEIINNLHLSTHGITTKEYKEKYPNARLSSDEFIFKKRNYSDKTRKKISNGRRGKKHTDEFKMKRSDDYKGNGNPMHGRKHTIEAKNKISRKSMGNTNAKGTKHPELCEYNRTHPRYGKENGNYGKHTLAGVPKTTEHKKRISKTRIEKGLSKGDKNPMSKEENIKKWIKSCNIKPNKKEAILNDFLQKILPNEYTLNVDACIMILGGKIPDFVNINGKKKIIELFGDYFHAGEDIQIKIDYFAVFGWECLVIWEHELKDLEKLRQRILDFHNLV